MRSKYSLKNPFLTLEIALALCLCTAPVLLAQDNTQQNSDGVADAARKSRDDKKTAAKPKKVFTEDDITPRPVTPSPQVQQPATGTAPNTNPISGEPLTAKPPTEESAGSNNVAPQESDEVTWRKRFKAARSSLAEAQKQLDILQRDLNKNEVQYYPDPQKAMQEQYSREAIKERKAKIDAKEAEVARLKQALSDLEDSLRKSGGDIGWSRE
jgi:polyhydroxyalkanoate synthesis regulator phasin